MSVFIGENLELDITEGYVVFGLVKRGRRAFCTYVQHDKVIQCAEKEAWHLKDGDALGRGVSPRRSNDRFHL